MKSAPWIYVLALVLIGLAIAAVTLVTILVIIRNDSYHNCKYDDVPYSISITKKDEEILISWYELSNEECNTSYKLQFRIDTGDTKEINTTQMYYTLPLFGACSTLYVFLWLISSDGSQSTNFTSKSYLEVPETSAVTDVEFFSSGNGLNVTWINLASLSKCNLSYQLSMDTDTGIMQYMETASEYVFIPESFFCLQIRLVISTAVNGLTLGDSDTSATYHDQDEIEGIQIEVFPEDNAKAIVSWRKHKKHYRCTLEYIVKYIDEDGREQVAQVEESTATFDANYCASTVLKIAAYNRVGQIAGPETTSEGTLDPTQIDEVTDVVFSQEDNKKIISWNVLLSFQKCNLTYKLGLKTDVGEFSITTADTTFEVPEEMYCTSLQFQIQAVYGEITSEPYISENYPFENPILLRSVRKPIASISETNYGAIVSWDSPRCVNQYTNLE